MQITPGVSSNATHATNRQRVRLRFGSCVDRVRCVFACVACV